MERIQGRAVHIVAFGGDPEFGGDVTRFGTLHEKRAAVTHAERDGVHQVVLLGDISHNGDPREMTTSLKALTDITNLPVSVITGNRDQIRVSAEDAAAIIGTTGVQVLDNKVVVIGEEGFHIAFLSINGSVPSEEIEKLKVISDDKRDWTPRLHEITREMFGAFIEENIQRIEADPTIDQLAFLTHIPADTLQQPKYARRTVLEMDPGIGQRVRRSSKTTFMASAHIHAPEQRWITVPEVNHTEEGILTLSKTNETARQIGSPLLTYVLFSKGHFAIPVTGDQLQRLRDGDLTFANLATHQSQLASMHVS